MACNWASRRRRHQWRLHARARQGSTWADWTAWQCVPGAWLREGIWGGRVADPSGAELWCAASRAPADKHTAHARASSGHHLMCAPIVPSISASLLTSAVAAHCLLASSTVARPFPDNPPVGASEVFGNFGRVPGQLLACQVEPCLGASAESSPPCPAAPWFKERGAAAQAAQALLCRAELPCGPQPTPNHMAPKQSRKRKAVAKPAEEVGPGRPTPNSHKRLTPSTGSAHRSECHGSARRRCFFSGGVVSGGVGMAEIPT